ncbi:MAG: response regulator transcription factor [Dehalococcoidia bacterium]|jgi:two-component system, NarL family, response regulator LiaR|nr:response regulator transcription factor [Dehalococcoidia bacterium]
MTTTDEAEKQLRVMIVDDHPLVRDGIRAMLESSGMAVVAEASSGEEAAGLAAQLQPDVVLMDIRMPGVDGLEATRRIKEAASTVAVIIVTSFESQDYLVRAIEAGAAGYVLKGASRQLLTDAVRVVVEGGSMFEPAMVSAMASEIGSRIAPLEGVLDDLNEREIQVLKLIANGCSNAEIAEQMNYSVGTIKNSVQQIIEKLSVSDRTQAAVLAVRAGLGVE